MKLERIIYYEYLPKRLIYHAVAFIFLLFGQLQRRFYKASGKKVEKLIVPKRVGMNATQLKCDQRFILKWIFD